MHLTFSIENFMPNIFYLDMFCPKFIISKIFVKTNFGGLRPPPPKLQAEKLKNQGPDLQRFVTSNTYELQNFQNANIYKRYQENS